MGGSKGQGPRRTRLGQQRLALGTWNVTLLWGMEPALVREATGVGEAGRVMSCSSDTLRFCLPAYGDAILTRINALRRDRRFCDITLLLGDAPQGSGPGTLASPLRFHGHRVVLAASSDFLRDQFLLHEGRPELCVAVVPNAEVGRRLLLSCYTGLLEVPVRELVSYLTAASALQMGQIVDRCAQAVSHYLDPTLAHLKAERQPGVADAHEEEGEEPGARGAQRRSDDPSQPSSSSSGGGSARAPGEDGGSADGALRQAKSETGAWESPQVTPREYDGPVKAEAELPGEAASCALLPPESDEENDGEEVQQAHANNSMSCLLHNAAHRRKQRPPTPFRDRGAFSLHGSPDARAGLADSSSSSRDPGVEEDSSAGVVAGEAVGGYLPRLPHHHRLPGGGGGGGDRVAEAREEVAEADSLLPQRPFLCRRCDRVFQHLEGFVSHLKEHRQYLCLLCGKSFSQKSNLTRHIRVHTGVKPFRCPLCHKTFSQKATLQDHLNLHTGDKPHKCNYCAVHFAHKPGLRRHLKDVHGKSSLQNVLEEIVD